MPHLATRLSLLVAVVAAFTAPSATQTQAMPAALLDTLEWRCIGPSRGGRVGAVAGVVGNRNTYYMGATGGGVWKTTDAGRNWKNVSDGSFGGSIGALAVAESDPNVIYVGTGEETLRGNVSSGDGVWKSTDAGRPGVYYMRTAQEVRRDRWVERGLYRIDHQGAAAGGERVRQRACAKPCQFSTHGAQDNLRLQRTRQRLVWQNGEQLLLSQSMRRGKPAQFAGKTTGSCVCFCRSRL
jgi:hypothetical protein